MDISFPKSKVPLYRWDEYFVDDRSKILEFLQTNGSYEDLKNLIEHLEDDDMTYEEICVGIWGSAPIITDQNTTLPMFEFPTNELCQTLFELFDYFKIESIQELGAGSGLISARLKQFKPNFQITASDKVVPIQTFYPVNQLRFSEIDSTEPVMISWLDPESMLEFVQTMGKIKPEYVFHIGQTNSMLGVQMAEHTYRFITIGAKQISKLDYFQYDSIKRKHIFSTRTCITVFTLNQSVDLDQILNQLTKSNLASFIPLDMVYVMQDHLIMNLEK